MKLIGSFALALLASVTALDPVDYFGGVDHQPYLDWADVHADSYDSQLFLASASDSDQGVALHWRLEEDESRLYLAVAARAEGWVAFGLSENGGMLGADVVIFTKAEPSSLTDAYIMDDYSVPITDDCQDWTLTQSWADDNGFLIFEAYRALDTGDNQDRVIIPDQEQILAPARIIAAWGAETEVSYHGPVNRARGAVRWTDSDPDPDASFAQLMDQEAEGFFDVRADQYAVPARDTDYAFFCMTRSDMAAQGVPVDSWEDFIVVGIEPIVDPNAARHVHHFTVFGSVEPFDDGNCGDDDFSQFYTLAYAWAPGEPPLALPPFAGVPLGPPTGFQSYLLNIHYDNPEEIEGVVDNSGVRFYYSSVPREHTMGVLQLGDPFVSMAGEPVGDGISEHTFSCPSGCSALALGGEPITVVREYLHMHQSGVAMRNEQIRDGEIVRTAAIDFFTYDQQANQVVQQEPYEVLPGDAFRTVCQYGAREPGETFGFSSQEEMCIVFIYYYPAKQLGEFPWICAAGIPFPLCAETYDSRDLEQVENRSFGLSRPDGVCPAESIPEAEADVVSDVEMEASEADMVGTAASDATTALRIGHGFGLYGGMGVLVASFVM